MIHAFLCSLTRLIVIDLSNGAHNEIYASIFSICEQLCKHAKEFTCEEDSTIVGAIVLSIPDQFP